MAQSLRPRRDDVTLGGGVELLNHVFVAVEEDDAVCGYSFNGDVEGF